MHKNSSVLDSKMGSRAIGMTNVRFGSDGDTEPSPAEVLALQDLSRFSEGLPQRHVPTDSLECDGYQVALVAPGSVADSNARVVAGPAHVFVLPLTWKDLAGLMRAEFEHSNFREANKMVRFGQVAVDFGGMTVTRSGKPVALTSMEFKMLIFLVRRPGHVISRDELLDEVWGYQNYPCTRTVDNHILRLRQKLESDPARPVHFLTVHSAGYKFAF
jgi:DNA-binding response OmpR family regulator